MAKQSKSLRTHRTGRRAGEIAFPKKNIHTTVGLQKKLGRDYLQAQARTGRSFSEILHLVSWSKLTVNDVTKSSFETLVLD